jgi:hypothetical protein
VCDALAKLTRSMLITVAAELTQKSLRGTVPLSPLANVLALKRGY